MDEKRFISIISDPEQFLSMAAEELAAVVLEVLNSINVNYFNRIAIFEGSFSEYPERYREQIADAVMEAWTWLERECMLAPMPRAPGSFFVTRRGKQVASSADFDAYRRANLLPRGLLHPVISQKVWGAFVRGDYDVAVLQGFKEVEVGVRAAAKLGPMDLGVELMRKAFHETTGPLTDLTAVAPERQALSHLFAGSMGLYKNPHSHRHVALKVDEAVEMIMLASHLLKIVDARKP